MMMDEKWGSGDPNQYLPGDHHLAAYDDHIYLKYAGIADEKDAYLQFSCNASRSGDAKPVIVGEWSLAVAADIESNSDWDPTRDENKDFYRKLWAAQVRTYETTAQGWVSLIIYHPHSAFLTNAVLQVFWTWKTTGTLNDTRWDYRKAVAAGIIDSSIDNAYSMDVCSKRNVASGSSGRNGASITLAALTTLVLVVSFCFH